MLQEAVVSRLGLRTCIIAGNQSLWTKLLSREHDVKLFIEGWRTMFFLLSVGQNKAKHLIFVN